MVALRLHCWNTEISEAFYGPLQYLEVSMRSVLTSRLITMFGRADWWAHPRIDLTYGARQRISEAAQQIQRTGLPADPQLITEELSFGFYVSLLGRGNNYDQRPMATGPIPAFPHFRGPRREL
ncbi:hypothetical protein [Nonomuraea dietziae]|uniref:hypothetical protein n=1 Tax=Nonomuraea dietziae TaxID=65515 RepID=UPI0031CE787B